MTKEQLINEIKCHEKNEEDLKANSKHINETYEGYVCDSKIRYKELQKVYDENAEQYRFESIEHIKKETILKKEIENLKILNKALEHYTKGDLFKIKMIIKLEKLLVVFVTFFAVTFLFSLFFIIKHFMQY